MSSTFLLQRLALFLTLLFIFGFALLIFGASLQNPPPTSSSPPPVNAIIQFEYPLLHGYFYVNDNNHLTQVWGSYSGDTKFSEKRQYLFQAYSGQNCSTGIIIPFDAFDVTDSFLPKGKISDAFPGSVFATRVISWLSRINLNKTAIYVQERQAFSGIYPGEIFGYYHKWRFMGCANVRKVMK
ncbi:14094_t:CDS:1 [Ambispora leptoticha]|uniref:14094_t:CDS:1 n=1 Tax=Ambispora leptoticha TaxID=144679 RepID=A0A9N9FTQ3_9GLOM|nr:14094_t:CDS:1 [Ambispora leptoticha]